MSAMDGWMAARVVRKHTLPHHRPEILAEHTWGVIHIMLYVWPDAPIDAVKAAMYHDVGEHKSGDIPGDFKADNPEVREFCDNYEHDAARSVLPERLWDSLQPSEQNAALVKFCDKAEFAFSCYHEWMLGNRYSLAPMKRTVDMMKGSFPSPIYENLPQEVQRRINEVTSEVIRLLQHMDKAMQPHKEIRFAS